MEHLHPPGYSVTATGVRTAIKETHCPLVVITCREKYKLRYISLSDFLLRPLTSSVFLTMFFPTHSSRTIGLCSSLNVSHSYYLFSRRGFSHNQWAMVQLALARTVSGSLHCPRWGLGLAGKISWGSRLAAAAVAAARSLAARCDTFHLLHSGNVARYSVRELQVEQRQAHYLEVGHEHFLTNRAIIYITVSPVIPYEF